MGDTGQHERVMAGLATAIHAFAAWMCGEDVDARHKAGHDGGERGAKLP